MTARTWRYTSSTRCETPRATKVRHRLKVPFAPPSTGNS